MEKYKFPPNRTYNVGESGLSTVQKPGRILARKGQKQVGKLTSAERGQNITVVCAMSASGSYVPPAFLFPRKNMAQQLMRCSPSGSKGFAVPSSWMDAETFCKWLEHFNHRCIRALQILSYYSWIIMQVIEVWKRSIMPEIIA